MGTGRDAMGAEGAHMGAHKILMMGKRTHTLIINKTLQIVHNSKKQLKITPRFNFPVHSETAHLSPMTEFASSAAVPVRTSWENSLLSCESKQFWQL